MESAGNKATCGTPQLPDPGDADRTYPPACVHVFVPTLRMSTLTENAVPAFTLVGDTNDRFRAAVACTVTVTGDETDNAPKLPNPFRYILHCKLYVPATVGA